MATSIALVSGGLNNVRDQCNESAITISLQMDAEAATAVSSPQNTIESQPIIQISGSFAEAMASSCERTVSL